MFQIEGVLGVWNNLVKDRAYQGIIFNQLYFLNYYTAKLRLTYWLMSKNIIYPPYY